MPRKQDSFPLVSDQDPVLGPLPQMTLYEESDLISNIRGPYQEKDFSQVSVREEGAAPTIHTQEEKDLLPPLFAPKTISYSRKKRKHTLSSPPYKVEKTEGQRARESAREDLKRKRSASYLQTEKKREHRPEPSSPAGVVQQEQVSHLSQLADRLRQTTYILADVPAVYSLKKEDREQGQPQIPKNSYEFLKKSQVYNYPERQKKREHQLAQELNLTHIEEEYDG